VRGYLSVVSLHSTAIFGYYGPMDNLKKYILANPLAFVLIGLGLLNAILGSTLFSILFIGAGIFVLVRRARSGGGQDRI